MKMRAPRLLTRWARITASIAALFFLSAGTLRIASLRNYLVAFSFLLLVAMLAVDPGLAQERAKPKRSSHRRVTACRRSTLPAHLGRRRLFGRALPPSFQHASGDTPLGAWRIPTQWRLSDLGHDGKSVLFSRSPATNRAWSSRHCRRPVPIHETPGLSRHDDLPAGKCVIHWLLACPHSSHLFCAHNVATGTNGRQVLAQASAGICRLRKPCSRHINLQHQTNCS
jgi:hypothetical protein